MTDVDLTMPICDLADWHIKVQPVIIHNCWYNKIYSCVKLFAKKQNCNIHRYKYDKRHG